MNIRLSTTLFPALAVWALAAAPAAAVGTLADIAVYDRTEQKTLAVYVHEGRHYIAGKPGNEYEITIRNRQPADLMAVVSVDGVNAVTGETAHWSQTGYVFGPHAAYGIKGWRKSLQRVARFYFTELEDSYAARSGRPDNVGVIGVALFRRKPDAGIALQRPPESRREAGRSDAAPAAAESATRDAAGRIVATPEAAAPAREKNLGTGHGAGESAPVRYTEFERAGPAPDEVVTLYYDSYRNLVAQGVIAAPRLARPSPFPGRFVPDPR